MSSFPYCVIPKYVAFLLYVRAKVYIYIFTFLKLGYSKPYLSGTWPKTKQITNTYLLA
jgi:hypothetical protein